MFRTVAAACLLLITGAAHAAVDRIEILSRTKFADGATFGEVGAYEKLRGRIWFAIDPKDPANRAVADIDLAPTDARGLVRFSADLAILRPADPAKASGTFLYEVNNRGGMGALQRFAEAKNADDPGTGFLMQRGMTLLWSGWATDVERSPNALLAQLPIATDRGAPITGRVAYEIIVDAPSDDAVFTGMRGTAYPRADRPDAVLTERTTPDGARSVIDAARWSFATDVVADKPGKLRLQGGFKPGKIYELIYTARDPHLVGLGLAGIRDLLAYARDNGIEGAAPAQRVLAFGISQSGRVLNTMLATALAIDERGRAAFDGALIHVSGAGKGSFDHRFAMTSRHFSMLEDHAYPTESFPMSPASTVDSTTGETGSLLDAMRAKSLSPKLMWVNNASEYWNRAASLLHTDPLGRFDLPEPDNVRIYALLGAQHYPGRDKARGNFANCVDPLQFQPVMRSLLSALEDWVRADKAPPPSRHPRIADGTLVTVDAYKRAFPHIAGVALPVSNLVPPRLALDTVPPTVTGSYTTLVPAPDRDGNDRGGILPAELLAPLGTRTGWNTRTETVGFAGSTGRFDGSFLPFARSEAERRASNDARPSLAARWNNRESYERAVRVAAERNVAQGFLLASDVDVLVARAGRFYDRVRAHDPKDRGCGYLFDES
ncbi:alpha/beta hydrolase domain-containing protein [Roseiterribacter gracilis]|uniref:Alpha/beta hydrolase domain-containing protein n=1 Tax=Roseiterribacter gracilis TaxID=2812848 RepID=A0A8S8XI00_9PROT|nr:hypothetical protein TMPK1_30720 [Rhodospirillales bacterium TMPK1]